MDWTKREICGLLLSVCRRTGFDPAASWTTVVARVLVHHHFTILQTLPVGGFKKVVDSSEPQLMLRINCSIPDLVTVFPFDGHGIEPSRGKGCRRQYPERGRSDRMRVMRV
jgi:hypothetical protein